LIYLRGVPSVAPTETRATYDDNFMRGGLADASEFVLARRGDGFLVGKDLQPHAKDLGNLAHFAPDVFMHEGEVMAGS